MLFARHVVDLPVAVLQKGSVVTIGSFDGLHLGHQTLLDRVLAIAKEEERASVVMSFEPTPKEFFQSDRPPARLMRFREKFEALAASEIDVFYCPRFSQVMRQITAPDFVRRILIQGLNVRRLVIGDDFHFAAKRQGNIELLERMGTTLDYSVEQLPSVVINGGRVSSTAIREACQIGDMQRAAELLGRPYRMSGKIIKGDQLGRTLGFPTANVDLRRRQSAVMGIFAVRVHGLNRGSIDGVASVGTRPTFGGTKPILEVFLFDFDDSIYGKYIHVDFIARLREQRRYELVDELVAQMHIDADNARSILADTAA